MLLENPAPFRLQWVAMHALRNVRASSLLPAAPLAACSVDVATGRWAAAAGQAAGNFGISTTAVIVDDPGIP